MVEIRDKSFHMLEDGTIRTAFDTCQICNGSPYAYFEQKGDKFQCENSGRFTKWRKL